VVASGMRIWRFQHSRRWWEAKPPQSYTPVLLPRLNPGIFHSSVRLPANLTPGAHFLCVTIGGVTSAPAAMSIL
jgi:hypothetical protein